MSLWQCSKCFKIYQFEEYLKLESKWIDENKAHGKTLICTCGKPFLQDKWQLKTEDPATGHTVSTVHLELGHESNMNNSTDEIMWYETMITDRNGEFLSFQARYPDQTKAIQGHELAIKLLPKIIENPEKYPSDMVTQFLDNLKK